MLTIIFKQTNEKERYCKILFIQKLKTNDDGNLFREILGYCVLLTE